ncbi:adenylate kinase [Alphaproteobacteria bacterium]|nr:adenylate kinase [Alphaproteobacteria bacterium]
MNVIFIGAPGSGKGTQSQMLQKHLGIVGISTGDALRSEVANKSEIGILAKSYMDSGQLVPDNVVIDIIKNIIVKPNCNNGFILDGFPRNVNQALELEKMLGSLSKKINKVVFFEVSDDILIKRISGRFSCMNCGAVYNHYFKPLKKEGYCDECGKNEFEKRDDDNEQTVKKRLEVYYQSSFPLIEFYKKKNLLVKLDALKIAPLIFEHLLLSLNS